MISKLVKAGDEVDAKCNVKTCKGVTLHIVLAVDSAGRIARVECKRCHSQHSYIAPPAPATAGTKKAASSSDPNAPKPAKAPRASKATSAAALAAQQAELLRERTWEKMVSGKGPTDFKPYRPTLSFEDSDLIHHAKFGDGYVQKILDRNKIEVMFRDGVRTLAQGMAG